MSCLRFSLQSAGDSTFIILDLTAVGHHCAVHVARTKHGLNDRLFQSWVKTGSAESNQVFGFFAREWAET